MWVLPTYGRPERCQAALDSIAACGGSSRGIVVIDGDSSEGYWQLRLPENWHSELLPTNVGVCEALNTIFRAYPNEPWYGFISDDSIVRTRGFEAPLVTAAGRTGFANSADGWQAHKRMHGAVVFGGDLLRALGWWAPPGLRHSFVDDAWEFLGHALGNWARVPQVLIEHHHFGNNKAERDATYDAAYASAKEDQATFYRLRRDELPAAVARAIPVVVGDDPARCRIARAKSRSVMIATPIGRHPVWQYTLAFAETCVALDRLGIPYRTAMIIGGKLPMARNEIVARFLASDCTDLICIDDDMGWKGDDVLRLIGSDKPVIAAVGRKRVDKPNRDKDVWCVKFPDDAGTNLVQDALGNVLAKRVGAAFMKIERSVFERMIKAHPDWKRTGKKEWGQAVQDRYYKFFSFDDGDVEMGEDFLFCDRWRALGGEVWIDPEIELSHVGEKDYRGAICEIMQPEAPAAMLEAAE